MVKYADSDGRYVFAPGDYMEAPYRIDKVDLNCRAIHLPYIPHTQLETFRDALDSYLFNGEYKNTLRIANSNQWLFSGTLSIRQARENRPGIELDLFLSINPTRYWRFHGGVTSREQRMRLFGRPDQSLNCSNPRNSEVADIRGFDGNDNFLVSGEGVHVHFTNWLARTREYLNTVIYLLAIKFVRASNSVGYNSGSLPQMVSEINDAQWSIKQIEFYWEFLVENAIQKMHAIAPTARRVLRNSYEADYVAQGNEDLQPPQEGIEANATYVKGELGRKEVFGKLYGKASRILRFEVAYLKSPLVKARCYRGRRRPRTRRDYDGLFENIEFVGRDATRSCHEFWSSFWNIHSTEPEPDLAKLEQLLNAVCTAAAAARTETVTPAELLSLLFHHQGGRPFLRASDEDMYGIDVFRYLAGRRVSVLEETPSSSPASQEFQLTPRFRSVVRHLHQSFNQVLEEEQTEQSELVRDEDPAPVTQFDTINGERRIRRPRTRMFNLEGGPINFSDIDDQRTEVRRGGFYNFPTYPGT